MMSPRRLRGKHAHASPLLDAVDHAIVDALAGGKGLATREIAGTIGLTPRATRTRLARLFGSGLLREVGAGPQDPQRRYFLLR
jgi:DNA-binding Lrp family transcriptional regulator